jgi:hypothetical protein
MQPVIDTCRTLQEAVERLTREFKITEVARHATSDLSKITEHPKTLTCTSRYNTE